MKLVLWIGIFLTSFCLMEFVAWFTHKYAMHGFLWVWHKDHHRKDHGCWFERNDAFFIFFAFVSTGLMISGGETSFWYGWPLGFGILAYGIAYFTVHDIFIHQRFKLLKNANNWYARGVRRAHRAHHRHLEKQHGECFGMLWVPLKYFKQGRVG